MRVLSSLVLVLTICPSIALAAGKVTTDPNAPGARIEKKQADSDPRLAQRVTYQVKLKRVDEALDDLTAMTGVKLYAGHGATDWRVREDRMNIHAKDIPLADLMNSIARVMKFAWSKGGKSPDFTYRLREDENAVRQLKNREADLKKQSAEKRRKYLAEVLSADSLSKDDLEKLRDDNPKLYMLVKSGVLGSMRRFLSNAPDVRDAWLDGRQIELRASMLPPSALRTYIDLCRDAGRLTLPSDSVEAEISSDQEASLLRSARIVVTEPRFAFPYGEIYLGSLAGSNGSLPLTRPESKRDKLIEKVQLRAWEEHRPTIDVSREMRPEIKKAESGRAKTDPWNYTMEPLLALPDEPWTHEKLKNKIDTKVITALVFSLANATGYCVVTDD